MSDTGPRTLSGPPADVSADSTPGSSQFRVRGLGAFGKYELLSRLRVGGMAEVFLAREQSAPDHQIAIKRILPSFTDEADYVAMFIDEARLGMQLKHSGIAEAFEIGQVDDVHYMALEYVHGHDLGALLRRAREHQEPLPGAIACHIALEVCRTLVYAHGLRDERGGALGIVHRDISPQNILISYAGEVKLIDFGIAKSSEQLMRTQAGLLKGKHGYLSPEQAQGKQVDRRSDIFSLGICLYEMLTAQRLFEGSSDFSTIVRVRKAEVPQLATRNAAVPRELAAIVHRALGRDRMERYQTAAEMMEALTRFVQTSRERCDRATLERFLRERLPEGSDVPASPEQRDRGTGLNAFDDLDPVSSVSQLADLSEAIAEPAAEPSEEIEPLEDDAGVLSEPAPRSDVSAHEMLTVVRGPEAADLADDATGIHHPHTIRGTSNENDLADREDATVIRTPTHTNEEPTRVVSYESTTEGHVAKEPSAPRQEEEPTDAGENAHGGTNPGWGERPVLKPASVRAPTLPGVGMEWDDEEQSTQIYDPPEEGEAVPVATHSTQQAPAMVTARFSQPSQRKSTLRTASVPPFDAAQGARAVEPVRPSASAGAPSPFVSTTSPGARTPSIAPTQRRSIPPRSDQRAMRWAALAVAVIVGVLVIGVWIFGGPSTGTIHLTTEPADVTVSVDGVVVPSGASPIVLSAITSGAPHAIEVAKPGYRSWKTQLSVRSGETLLLPLVRLMPETPAPPPVSAAQPLDEPQPADPSPVVANPEPPRGVDATPPRPRPKPVTRPTPRPEKSRPAPVNVTAAQGGTGTLRINSRPWSIVYVDGRMIGNTPQMNVVLAAGRHTVTLANTAFDLKKTLTVQIKQGETVTKIVDLAQ